MAKDELDALRARTPDELHPELISLIQQVQAQAEQLQKTVEAAFEAAPKADRDTFARWVAKHHPQLKRYLSARWDKKPLLPLIYRWGFRK